MTETHLVPDFGDHDDFDDSHQDYLDAERDAEMLPDPTEPPEPEQCDRTIAMQGYDAVPCEREAGHGGIHWSNAELTATAPEPAQDGRTPVRRAPGGGDGSGGADGASVRSLGGKTAGDILNLVHTVQTRGGVGEIAGVRIERVEDGTTVSMRRLEEAREAIERVRAQASRWDERVGTSLGRISVGNAAFAIRRALDGGTEADRG